MRYFCQGPIFHWQISHVCVPLHPFFRAMLCSSGHPRAKIIIQRQEYEPAESEEGDTVQHSFSLAEMLEPGTDEALLDAARLFWQMMPDRMPNFSIARYTSSDHISPHDDRVLEIYTHKEYKVCILVLCSDFFSNLGSR